MYICALIPCECAVRRRKPEMIIRENQPMELPPEVFRGILLVCLELLCFITNILINISKLFLLSLN